MDPLADWSEDLVLLVLREVLQLQYHGVLVVGSSFQQMLQQNSQTDDHLLRSILGLTDGRLHRDQLPLLEPRVAGMPTEYHTVMFLVHNAPIKNLPGTHHWSILAMDLTQQHEAPNVLRFQHFDSIQNYSYIVASQYANRLLRRGYLVATPTLDMQIHLDEPAGMLQQLESERLCGLYVCHAAAKYAGLWGERDNLDMLLQRVQYHLQKKEEPLTSVPAFLCYYTEEDLFLRALQCDQNKPLVLLQEYALYYHRYDYDDTIHLYYWNNDDTHTTRTLEATRAYQVISARPALTLRLHPLCSINRPRLWRLADYYLIGEARVPLLDSLKAQELVGHFRNQNYVPLQQPATQLVPYSDPIWEDPRRQRFRNVQQLCWILHSCYSPSFLRRMIFQAEDFDKLWKRGHPTIRSHWPDDRVPWMQCGEQYTSALTFCNQHNEGVLVMHAWLHPTSIYRCIDLHEQINQDMNYQVADIVEEEVLEESIIAPAAYATSTWLRNQGPFYTSSQMLLFLAWIMEGMP